MNKNEINLVGYINNVKTLQGGINVASFAVSTKVSKKDETPKYKNGYINITSKLPLEEGKKVEIKGFVTFDFYEDKNNPGKELQKIKVFVTEII